MAAPYFDFTVICPQQLLLQVYGTSMYFLLASSFPQKPFSFFPSNGYSLLRSISIVCCCAQGRSYTASGNRLRHQQL